MFSSWYTADLFDFQIKKVIVDKLKIDFKIFVELFKLI
jgi:hypothetical protein